MAYPERDGPFDGDYLRQHRRDYPIRPAVGSASSWKRSAPGALEVVWAQFGDPRGIVYRVNRGEFYVPQTAADLAATLDKMARVGEQGTLDDPALSASGSTRSLRGDPTLSTSGTPDARTGDPGLSDVPILKQRRKNKRRARSVRRQNADLLDRLHAKGHI